MSALLLDETFVYPNFDCKEASSQPSILDPIAPICSRLLQLLLQGELKCEAARQEGTVEQAATAGVNLKQARANTNIHAAVVSIIAQNTGDIP
jgi:hypothetical protein